MTNYLKGMLGDARLEDIWVGTYCVSANFSNASTKVHDTGLAWKQVLLFPGFSLLL